VILNRALEAARHLRAETTVLRRRAARHESRSPLILVPSVLGVRLADERGRGLWGWTRQLYVGPDIGRAARAEPRGLIDGFAAVPGVVGQDCYGALVRYLEGVGHYRRNEDLFVLEYDWRLGIAHGAKCLDGLIRQVKGAGDERVDLVGVSTGGVIIRHWLTWAGGDAAADAASPVARVMPAIGRVIYAGTPQRGSFHTLEMLVHGIRPAPLGRRFTAAEIAGIQTAWDCLPHPDEPVFVDEGGHPLPFSLYDVETWRRLGLLPTAAATVAKKLEAASQLHRALDQAPPPVDATVIGGRHLPTTYRALVRGDRVEWPACQPRSDDPFVGLLYTRGDGSLPEHSLRGLPGLDDRRLSWATPPAHHRIPSDPEVHRAILESLLTDERPPIGARAQHIPLTALASASTAAHA
jgi:hypothetical protein